MELRNHLKSTGFSEITPDHYNKELDMDFVNCNKNPEIHIVISESDIEIYLQYFHKNLFEFRYKLNDLTNIVNRVKYIEKILVYLFEVTNGVILNIDNRYDDRMG